MNKETNNELNPAYRAVQESVEQVHLYTNISDMMEITKEHMKEQGMKRNIENLIDKTRKYLKEYK